MGSTRRYAGVLLHFFSHHFVFCAFISLPGSATAAGCSAAVITADGVKNDGQPVPAIVSRVMLPDDANPGGFVHGGTILRMIDEAGWVVATRHANSNGGERNKKLSAALVRVEHMDFMERMLIGEVARVSMLIDQCGLGLFNISSDSANIQFCLLQVLLSSNDIWFWEDCQHTGKIFLSLKTCSCGILKY